MSDDGDADSTTKRKRNGAVAKVTFCKHLQVSAKRRSPVLVNFVPALAYHFCLALSAAFTQPGDHLLAKPCRGDCQKRPSKEARMPVGPLIMEFIEFLLAAGEQNRFLAPEALPFTFGEHCIPRWMKNVSATY